MGELINGRTPEEIKQALCVCIDEEECEPCSCNYYFYDNCHRNLMRDSLALIQHLEAKQPKWISVKERLPEDGELVLITMSGDLDGRRHFIQSYELATHWTRGEDNEEVYHEGGWELWDYEERRVNGFEVFHWMPLPEAPKEEIG